MSTSVIISSVDRAFMGHRGTSSLSGSLPAAASSSDRYHRNSCGRPSCSHRLGSFIRLHCRRCRLEPIGLNIQSRVCTCLRMLRQPSAAFVQSNVRVVPTEEGYPTVASMVQEMEVRRDMVPFCLALCWLVRAGWLPPFFAVQAETLVALLGVIYLCPTLWWPACATGEETSVGKVYRFCHGAPWVARVHAPRACVCFAPMGQACNSAAEGALKTAISRILVCVCVFVARPPFSPKRCGCAFQGAVCWRGEVVAKPGASIGLSPNVVEPRRS